jgi:uncharacterized membrane protein YfcA
MQVRLDNIKAFPAIAVSVILAFTLLLFGIYVMIPTDLLGLAISKAYPNIFVRSIFGIFMAFPAIPILYCNIKYDIKTLVKDKMPKLRPYIFWMGVTYGYMCALRILIAGVFPPIFLLYLTLSAISFVVWLSNRYL